MDQAKFKGSIFLGISENGVKTQLWVAITVYVLVAIVKKKLKLTYSRSEILQYISLVPFEEGSISEVFLNNEIKMSKNLIVFN